MAMKRTLLSIAMLSLLLGAAPATQPAVPASLETRAATAFDNGQYALALPLLQKLESLYTEPEKKAAVAEKIRVCQKQIEQAQVPGGSGDLAAAAEAPTGPRKPHAPPKPGEVRELEIKDLGNFEYDADKGGNIPEDVKALAGATLKVRGFMIPIDQTDNITQFALVPSLFACCFGQPPQLQHTIVCKAPSGKAVGYYPDELVVEGKLKVEEKKDEGFIISVFELDVSSVKPAAK
jgi:hypothetical protein